MNITKQHPVRNEIASLPNYWQSGSAAINEVARVLEHHGMGFDYPDFAGDSGYVSCPIYRIPAGLFHCSCCDKPEELDNCIVFSYYELPSGRMEVIIYIS